MDYKFPFVLAVKLAQVCVLSSFLYSTTLNGQISCIDNLNISLNHECESQLTPGDILSDVVSGESYTLMVRTLGGEIVPNNLLTEAHLWSKLEAKVTNSNNNSCWGYVNVEDKLGPNINCAMVAIECVDMDRYRPTATDNCSSANVEVIGEAIKVLNCDPNFVKTISFTYLATDDFGNTSTCIQDVNLKLFDSSTIVWPDSLTLEKGTNLTCSAPVNDEGFPDVSVTGIPMSGDSSLFPLLDTYCNISMDFSDYPVFEGCNSKIMRTWRLTEWTCDTDIELETYVQIIEVRDTVGPTLTNCPAVITLDADPFLGCEAMVSLNLPTVSDDCNDILEIDIAYEGGFINNATGVNVVRLSGVSTVTYTVYDDCDNSATCATEVNVRDALAPNPVCDQQSVVSLRSDGTAIALPRTFDDGSIDNCNLFKMVVQRPTSFCDCERPYFDDMKYLGEHEGHFYYLSNDRVNAPWAMDLSKAIGGNVVHIDNIDESNWVVNTALAHEDSIYIGIKKKNELIGFVNSDHSNLSFTNWADGQFDMEGNPLTNEEYVIINEEGKWELVTGAERFKYIYEVDDPCGFGDRVRFCCDDAGSEHDVTLRVIDASGRFSECDAKVLVQDKVAPVLTCPPTQTVQCGATIIFDDNYQVTDQCLVNPATISLDRSNLSSCGDGFILRTFEVTDASGSSTCVQRVNVVKTSGFDPSTIRWPGDHTSNAGCTGNGFDPSTLPEGKQRPEFDTGLCDNVEILPFEDRTFTFSGAGSDACFKVLRTWKVVDWCEPLLDGVNPIEYQQTIKVNNIVKPTISGCADLVVETDDCSAEDVMFQITAQDDCAPFVNVTGNIILDEFSNGTEDETYTTAGNTFSFNENLPLGFHSLLISFEDFCGNTESCTKIIEVRSVAAPTITCKSSVTVVIQGMDLDNDASTPDVFVAMVDPSILVESIASPCGFTVQACFGSSPCRDQEIFTCDDVGDTVELPVYAVDSRGGMTKCAIDPLVTIQDSRRYCSTDPVVIEIDGTEDEVFQDFLCGDPLHFPFIIRAEDCFEVPRVTIEVDELSDGSTDRTYTFRDELVEIDEVLEEGVHTIEITVAACGTLVTEVKRVTVECAEITLELDDTIPSDVEINCGNPEPIMFDVIAVSENCQENPVIEVFLDIDSDGDFIKIDEVEFDYIFEDILPIGTHAFRFVATACGMVEQLDKTIRVRCLSSNIEIEGCEDTGTIVTCAVASDNILFDLNLIQTGDCDESFEVDIFLDENSTGNFIFNNEFTSDGLLQVGFNLGEGTHTVRFEVEACGEIEICEKEITVACSEDITLRGCEPVTVNAIGPGQASVRFLLEPSADIAACDFPNGDLSIEYTIDEQSDGTIDRQNSDPFFMDVIGFEKCGIHTIEFNMIYSSGPFGEPICEFEASCTTTVTVNCVQTELAYRDCPDSDLPIQPGCRDYNILGGACNVPVDLCQNYIVSCDEDAEFRVFLDLFDDGTIDQMFTQFGEGPFNEEIIFANGVHSVSYELEACSEVLMCTEKINVVNSYRFEAECKSVEVVLNDNGEASIAASDIDDGSFDNCVGINSFSVSPSQFDCNDVGMSQSVVLTVTNNDNVSRICTATVDVKDETAPEFTCVAGRDVNLDDNGFFDLANAVLYFGASDNCAIVTELIDPPTVTCDMLGPPRIDVTVELRDQTGNGSSCVVPLFVRDNRAPTCTLVPDLTIDVSTGDYVLNVGDLLESYSDNCNTAIVNPRFLPETFSCSMAGDNLVTLFAEDDTGNTTSCTTFVSVICPGPSEGDSEISGCATEIFQFDECQGEDPFVNFELEINNGDCVLPGDNTVIVKLDLDNDGSIDFREDLLTVEDYLYARETPEGVHALTIEVINPCNVFFTCTKEFSVQCQEGFDQSKVYGRIINEDEESIQSVSVSLKGSGFPIVDTKEDGLYAFPEMDLGGQYKVEPSKDTDHLNGVSTLDIIKIQRHILGIEKLESPYKLIAADVDRSGNINGLDLIELRKLILGVYDALPKNDAWRMIDASHTFIDHSNPWASAFPESYQIYNFIADMEVDFIGVKVGDVNNSAVYNSNQKIGTRSLADPVFLQTDATKMLAGEFVHIPFKIQNDDSWKGLQFELEFDQNKVEFIALEGEEIEESNYHQYDNKLRMSFNTSKETSIEFELILLAKDFSDLEDVIQLAPDFNNEVYSANHGLPLAIGFNNKLKSKEITLFQNTPNPWKSETTIQYEMPYQDEVILSVYDLNGKLVYQEQRAAKQGMNNIVLTKDQINTQGILYFELISGQVKLLKKMVVIE